MSQADGWLESEECYLENENITQIKWKTDNESLTSRSCTTRRGKGKGSHCTGRFIYAVVYQAD